MATVLIEYQGNVDGLEASLKEIEKANEQVSDSAKQSAKEVSDEYRKVAQASKAAFASEETKKALAGQTAAVDKLRDELELLFKEEVKLLQQGKKSTEQYKKNREEAERVRAEFDKLNNSQNNQVKAQEKGVQAGKKLTTQLRDLKEELARLESQGQLNTAEFQKVAIEAAKLEDQIGDTQERIKTLASDTFVFDAAVDSVRALAGGFAVAEGAAALFAEDNQELQEAIAKTNAALAILNGLQEVSAFLSGQSAGKLAILKISQAAYSAVVNTSSVALKAFRLALVATGIGAAVVALGSLVFLFDSLNKSVGSSAPLIKRAGDRLKELKADAQDASLRLRELRGEITQSDVERIKTQKEFNNQLKADLIPLLIQQSKLEKDIILNKKTIETLDEIGDNAGVQRLRERIALQNEELKTVNKTINEIIAANRERRKQALEIIELENKDNKDKNKDILNNEKDFTQEISDEFRKRAAIVLSIEEEKNQKLLEFSDFLVNIDETSNEELLNQRVRFLKRIEAEDEGGLQNRLNIIRTEGDAQIAGIEERLGFTRDAQNQVKLIEAETQERLRAERKRTRDELIKDINIGIDAAQQSFNAIADLAKDSADRRIEQINRIAEVEAIAIENSRSSEAQKQREREALETRTTRKVIEERRKLARIEKAQGIFNATIDTAQAIVGFLSDPGGIPGIFLSVAAGITGATQIAKISSQPLPSFGKGGWIEGEKHTRGGVNINAEGGEFITKASTATVHKKELEAMNTSRAAFLKVIEERYVRPRLMEYALNKNSTGMNVNVDARLNSASMENELRGLRKDTRNTNKAISKAFSQSYSSRYNWN
jgi:hypothetical protein